MSVPAPIVDFVNFLIPAGIFAMLALALNIQWGHTGLFNAGVAAFLAIGAYMAAIYLTPYVAPSIVYPGHWGYAQVWQPWFGTAVAFVIAVLLSTLLAAFVGLLIALPILRLRTDYFAIATLALAEIIRLILTNAQTATAGTIGILRIPGPFDTLLPGDPDLQAVAYATLVIASLIVMFWLVQYVTRAPWGRVLRGIREDEEATLALGKNVFSFRTQAFVFGCALMGAAGGFLASHLGSITPDNFNPLATFAIYVMVILGGSGNNFGVIFGAFLYYSLDWVSVRIDDYFPPALAEKMPAIRFAAIGVILVALILFRPEGIFKEKKRTYPAVTK